MRAALARCVGDTQRFFDEVWEREVHLQPDADGASLLDLDDVDGLLADAALRAPAFRLVKAGDPLPPESYLRTARIGSRTITDLIDVGRVHDLFADGATIVLQGLHRYWPPLTAFCGALERALTHPVQANAYLTPPTASGLRVHSDAHDVFALQSHGTKHWVTYPMGAHPDDLPAPTLDRTIGPGDCLYVPRGTPHAARTEEAASLHITIGIRVTTWADVLRRAVDGVLAAPAYRGALPPGYAEEPASLEQELRNRLGTFASELASSDPAPLLEAAAQRFLAGRQPALRGQLWEMLALDEISDGTVLHRRPEAQARARSRDAHVELLLADRRLRMPAVVEPALRWVLEQEAFRVGDLAPYLDAAGRVTLARRLVREGLLTTTNRSGHGG